jgi:hypothetical protein
VDRTKECGTMQMIELTDEQNERMKKVESDVQKMYDEARIVEERKATEIRIAAENTSKALERRRKFLLFLVASAGKSDRTAKGENAKWEFDEDNKVLIMHD